MILCRQFKFYYANIAPSPYESGPSSLSSKGFWALGFGMNLVLLLYRLKAYGLHFDYKTPIFKKICFI